MHTPKRRHLNYANVVATLALVFAMSGGALAAKHYLINSTSQISPKVLKKLKGNTGKTGATGLAGKQGAAGKEGKEGPPGKEGKEGPAGKEGASGVLRWSTTVQSAGKSKEEPAVAVLAKAGPFTVTGHCYENGVETAAATYISSSEEGGYAQGYFKEGEVPLTQGKEVQVSEDVAEAETSAHEPSFLGPDDGSWAAETHDGSLALDGFGTQGVWLQGESGPACTFSGYLVTE